jgi:hypothetical protein
LRYSDQPKVAGSGNVSPRQFGAIENRLITNPADYRPIGLTLQRQGWLASVAEGKLTAGQLLARYAGLVFGQTGTIEETARRLELDRRTVRGCQTSGSNGEEDNGASQNSSTGRSCEVAMTFAKMAKYKARPVFSA